jgi:1,4-dihydroxy-2-naphthoyl-CoA hydrolase
LAQRKTRGGARADKAIAASPVLRGGMPRMLGIRVLSLGRRKVVAEMPVRRRHMNIIGRVNGGAIMAFADIVAAVGAVALRPPGYRGGTIESKTNFFAAGTGPALKAVAKALHVGRTTTVWQTTVANADGSTVAIVTQTQIMIPAHSADTGAAE